MLASNHVPHLAFVFPNYSLMRLPLRQILFFYQWLLMLYEWLDGYLVYGLFLIGCLVCFLGSICWFLLLLGSLFGKSNQYMSIFLGLLFYSFPCVVYHVLYSGKKLKYTCQRYIVDHYESKSMFEFVNWFIFDDVGNPIVNASVLVVYYVDKWNPVS